MYEIIWLAVPKSSLRVWTPGKPYPLYVNEVGLYEFLNDKQTPTTIGRPESWTSPSKDMSWVVRPISTTPEDYSSLL